MYLALTLFMPLSAANSNVSGFGWKDIAVPIGVVIAAVISFLALLWTTKRNIANAQDTLEKTLASQERINAATLDTQRDVASAERIWNEQLPLYNAILGRTAAFIQYLRESKTIEAKVVSEHFWYLRHVREQRAVLMRSALRVLLDEYSQLLVPITLADEYAVEHNPEFYSTFTKLSMCHAEIFKECQDHLHSLR